MASAPRPSIVDVFENFLKDDIAGIKPEKLQKLNDAQQAEISEEIDRFLIAAQSNDYSPDAVVLDGMASPITLPHDRSQPRTTRRAKQIALAHSEVIFSLEEYELSRNLFGVEILISFVRWVQTNAPLLRHHVFSLVGNANPLDTISPAELMAMTDDVRSDIGISELVENYSELSEFPDADLSDATRAKLTERAGGLLLCALQDAASAGRFGAGLSFTDVQSAAMFQRLVRKGSTHPLSRIDQAALLGSLEIPAIDDLPDDDFILIRNESEGFSQFRSVLSRSLQETSERVDRGQDLDQAFARSLTEVRVLAENLRAKTRETGLRRFMKENNQNIAMGTVMTAAATAVTNPVSLSSLHATVPPIGAALVAGTIYALLTQKPLGKDRRLLRFYDVLLGDG